MAIGIFIWEDCSPEGLRWTLGDGVVSRGEALIKGLGSNFSQKLKHFADIICRFLRQKNNQNLKISAKLAPWFLTSLFQG